MAEESVEQGIKLTRVEQEKNRQSEAGETLYQEWILPENLADMKSFAFGKFTWRDIILSAFALAIPVIIFLPLQLFIPIWLCIVFGVAAGIPLVFLVNKHAFTGDLPIEERLKISLNNRGESDLLHWDKTKVNGRFSEASTQSTVPEVIFTDDNVVLLPDSRGGFGVISVVVNDTAKVKHTETLQLVMGFAQMLNSLVNDTDCTPIQILLKSSPKNLGNYIDSALDDVYRIESDDKGVMASRAEDYAALLIDLDSEKAFFYDYYIVVTYRDDAENVGNESMNTMSARRLRMKEKANPLRKKQNTASQVDFEIGEDRKKKVKELNREKEFGKKKTLAILERRITTSMGFLSDLGSTNTEVKPRLLNKEEVAKLFFECYNDTDKNTIDAVITQSIEDRETLFSVEMYNAFPELFSVSKRKPLNKTQEVQRRGSLGKGE